MKSHFEKIKHKFSCFTLEKIGGQRGRGGVKIILKELTLPIVVQLIALARGSLS